MNEPSFESVKEGERRFRVIEAPKVWSHKLTEEQLSKVDPVTAERWKLANIEGQQIEWIIQQLAAMGSALYFLEGESIRSMQFRKYLWTRITFAMGLGGAIVWVYQHFFSK